MSNKNDRWSALSMKERADLMNMYITNGISDIKEMKKHYNSFSGEEDTKTTNKPLFDPQKIIDNVPAREWGPQKVLGENDYFVRPGTNMLAAPVQYFADKNTGKQNIEFANQIILDFENMENKQEHIDKNSDYYKTYLDALHYLNHVEGLKKYLGLPYDNSIITESKYKPTRLQNSDEKVYKFSNEKIPQYWGDVVDDMTYNNHEKKQYLDQTLNTFTAYKDRDSKGDFISIYDEWDYNPFIQGGPKILNNIIDIATGGKPFVIYDRIYLDDYYNIPEEFRGNPFISPAIVTALSKETKKELIKKGISEKELENFKNGGKLLTKNIYSGIKNTQTPPVQIMPSDALLQGLYQNIDKIGFERVEPAITTIEQVWEKADKEYDDFIDKLYSLDYKEPFTDDSERVTITAPNTTISKFIFNNKISKNALAEIARVSKLRNQDPYDVLAHMLIEGSGYDITTDTRYNTHDSLTGQIKPKYYNYFKDDRVKQLKQFGIWQKDKTFTVEEILKASEKFNKERDEQLNNVIRAQSYIDEVALMMLLKGRDFNPAQKGYVNSKGEEVKNTYLDMIDSAITSLKENMPDLFK